MVDAGLSPVVGDDEQQVGLALDAMGRTIAGGPSGRRGGPSGVTMVDAGPDALLLKPDDGPTSPGCGGSGRGSGRSSGSFWGPRPSERLVIGDRKSTRLDSSHH